MSYVFDNVKAATFKFTKGAATARNLTFNGINSSITSAQTVVNGIQRMLWITDQVNDYEPTEGVRTVKQNVNNNE